jgi:hypothetical protein
MTPAGVMRPILFPLRSVNQTFPSAPAVMPAGMLAAVGIGNSVMAPRTGSSANPEGMIRPMLFPSVSVNQTLPSGPVAIWEG